MRLAKTKKSLSVRESCAVVSCIQEQGIAISAVPKSSLAFKLLPDRTSFVQSIVHGEKLIILGVQNPV